MKNSSVFDDHKGDPYLDSRPSKADVERVRKSAPKDTTPENLKGTDKVQPN